MASTYAYTKYNVGKINCLRVSYCSIPFAKFDADVQAKIRLTISRYNSQLMGRDMDEEIQLLMWVLKRTDMFKELNIDPHGYIIKVREGTNYRFSVRCDISTIYFEDFDLWRVRNIPAHVSTSTLYHTSPYSHITELYPSYGGRTTNHSVYCDPRIYCTSEPTTGGGWPLLRGDSAIAAIHDLERLSLTNKDRAKELLIKWLAHTEDLTIYTFPRGSHKLYWDPETPTGNVFYINTYDPIDVKRISSDNLVTYDYIHDKGSFLMRTFMDKNPDIRDAAKRRANMKKLTFENNRLIIRGPKWSREFV